MNLLLLMNLDVVDIIQLVVTFLAGILVVWEQWKGKSKWKSWRLWTAGALLLFSLILVWVSSSTANKLEREHRADLLLIQKQNTALNSLWIEFQLQPHNESLNRGCRMQIATYSQVTALLVRSGLIAEYIGFQYHPDSGWYRTAKYVPAWPDIKLQADSSKQTVRFEMSPFGIRAQTGGMLLWKAERVADISLVRFEFSLLYGSEFPDPNNLSVYAYAAAPDLSWNPIKYICLYANSCEPENLITRLVPKERSYGKSHDYVYFHPENQTVVDSDWFRFYPDLLPMRGYILEALK